MGSPETKLDALETTTQLKINRQFLKRIEILEKDIAELMKRIPKLENGEGNDH